MTPPGKTETLLLMRALQHGNVRVHSARERAAALKLMEKGLLLRVGRGSYLTGIRYVLVQPKGGTVWETFTTT